MCLGTNPNLTVSHSWSSFIEPASHAGDAVSIPNCLFICTGTNPSTPVLHSCSGGSKLASHARDPGSSPRERAFIV